MLGLYKHNQGILVALVLMRFSFMGVLTCCSSEATVSGSVAVGFQSALNKALKERTF